MLHAPGIGGPRDLLERQGIGRRLMDGLTIAHHVPGVAAGTHGHHPTWDYARHDRSVVRKSRMTLVAHGRGHTSGHRGNRSCLSFGRLIAGRISGHKLRLKHNQSHHL